MYVVKQTLMQIFEAFSFFYHIPEAGTKFDQMMIQFT